ncbi:proton-conducting membrane transporter [Mesorhizobium sp. A623]
MYCRSSLPSAREPFLLWASCRKMARGHAFWRASSDWREAMTFFYMLLAFLVGLGVGWFLWGRRLGELNDLRSNLGSTRSERDRLKADANRLGGELEACASARADLERQLSEARAKPSPAALISAPVAATSRPSTAPKGPAASALAKPAKVKAAKIGSARPKAEKSNGKDNLRRLIGIGPVNERRLNEHGITTFAQIAAWTTADVKSVEDYLQFDGRIKREQWVQQAKLLAAGNEKEFARRFPTARSSGNT